MALVCPFSSLLPASKQTCPLESNCNVALHGTQRVDAGPFCSLPLPYEEGALERYAFS